MSSNRFRATEFTGLHTGRTQGSPRKRWDEGEGSIADRALRVVQAVYGGGNVRLNQQHTERIALLLDLLELPEPDLKQKKAIFLVLFMCMEHCKVEFAQVVYQMQSNKKHFSILKNSILWMQMVLPRVTVDAGERSILLFLDAVMFVLREQTYTGNPMAMFHQKMPVKHPQPGAPAIEAPIKGTVIHESLEIPAAFQARALELLECIRGRLSGYPLSDIMQETIFWDDEALVEFLYEGFMRQTLMFSKNHPFKLKYYRQFWVAINGGSQVDTPFPPLEVWNGSR